MSPLFVIAGAAFAQEAPPADDYRGIVDQAKFYLKKRWYADARAELERAVAHPDGQLDPEAWLLLAQTAFALRDLDAALRAADRAHSAARTDEELATAAGYAAWLRDGFGVVDVSGPHLGMGSTLDVELAGILFDPEQKRWLDDTAHDAGAGVLLPHRLVLPVGEYVINGVPVTVRAGEAAAVGLSAAQVRGRGRMAFDLAEMALAAGIFAWVGDEDLLPAPHVQLSVTQPLGGLFVGVFLDSSAQPYRTPVGTPVSFGAQGVGLRVGAELPGLHPLVLRTSVGARAGTLPGVARPCVTAGDGYDCAPDSAADLLVYGVARTVGPYFELDGSLLDRTQRRKLGVGFKGTVHPAWGWLPTEQEAVFFEDEPSVSASFSGDRSTRAVGIGMLINAAFAF